MQDHMLHKLTPPSIELIKVMIGLDDSRRFPVAIPLAMGSLSAVKQARGITLTTLHNFEQDIVRLKRIHSKAAGRTISRALLVAKRVRERELQARLGITLRQALKMERNTHSELVRYIQGKGRALPTSQINHVLRSSLRLIEQGGQAITLTRVGAVALECLGDLQFERSGKDCALASAQTAAGIGAGMLASVLIVKLGLLTAPAFAVGIVVGGTTFGASWLARNAIEAIWERLE